jgi:hypothetical protein
MMSWFENSGEGVTFQTHCQYSPHPTIPGTPNSTSEPFTEVNNITTSISPECNITRADYVTPTADEQQPLPVLLITALSASLSLLSVIGGLCVRKHRVKCRGRVIITSPLGGGGGGGGGGVENVNYDFTPGEAYATSEIQNRTNEEDEVELWAVSACKRDSESKV